jgi:flagella basal body P-ring formation protein FlgA
MLAQIALGPAPEFGSTVVLNRAKIQERIQNETGPLAGATVSGAGVVQVRVQGRSANPIAIASILKSSLLKTTPWTTAEIEIRSIGGIKGIELPPDGVELRISSNPTIVGRRRILAPIEVVHAGKTQRCFWITAEISVRASVLVASRKIALDKLITPDDFVKTVADIPDLRAAYAVHPEEVLGKASRRSFSAGDPLTREAFSDPFLVRHGETVRLSLERNGIVLKALARAEQDGKLGQLITVRNLDFSAPLKARVIGPAAVKLQ